MVFLNIAFGPTARQMKNVSGVTFSFSCRSVSQPVLIHYGSFEATFLKKMYDRYGGPPEASAAAKAIASPVNLLSVIYAQVYFPVYSNGLKDIARFLGFKWTNPLSSGLQSIVWRHQWEALGDPAVREMLTAYNTDDCEALNVVVRILLQIAQSGVRHNAIHRFDARYCS